LLDTGGSGSTVFDAVLGNHHGLFGAGELSKIFSEVLQGGQCSCGRTDAEFIFWKDVLKVLEQRLAGLNIATMGAATRSVERFPQLPNTDRPMAGRIYKEIWAEM